MENETRLKVRNRANHRCEYCLLPQSYAPFFTFHIEHIQANQHILDDSLDNLALACPHCNLNKGPNLTTLDEESREIVPLFHPRQHKWNDHFELRGNEIIGISAIGKATARLLKMNTQEQLEVRKVLLERNEFH